MKQKLTSRKFWALIAGVVVAILAFFNCSENVVTQVTALIVAVGSVVTYIAGEATVDSARENNTISLNDIESED